MVGRNVTLNFQAVDDVFKFQWFLVGSMHVARLIYIGLTGGIGCGKTTVARLLADRRAYLIDADEAAREALAKGQSAWRRLVRKFGETILRPDGEVDRRKLSSLVFRDPQKRAMLEAMVHPQVKRIWQRTLERYARERRFKAAVIEMPLLYEVNIVKLFDVVIVVACGRQTQINRLRARGLSTREAEARIHAQWPLQEKIDRADYVIWNDGPKTLLQQQANYIWKLISGGKAAWDKKRTSICRK